MINSVDKLLRSVSYSLADIGALAYGAGPGLFSGIRAACTAAQGIAFVRQTKVAQVTTTQALAQLYSCHRSLVAYPAHLGHFYMAAYTRSNNKWKTVLEPILANAQQMPMLEGDWQLCTRQRSRLNQIINRCVTGRMENLPVQRGSIAPAIAILGMQAWREGKMLAPHQALPVYVRNQVAYTKQELATKHA